jgi:hypothetical protein
MWDVSHKSIGCLRRGTIAIGVRHIRASIPGAVLHLKVMSETMRTLQRRWKGSAWYTLLLGSKFEMFLVFRLRRVRAPREWREDEQILVESLCFFIHTSP